MQGKNGTLTQAPRPDFRSLGKLEATSAAAPLSALNGNEA